MADNKELDHKRLTFSQAQGYEDLPRQLALEELDEKARNKLWDVLFVNVWEGNQGSVNWKGPHWISVFRTLHSSFLEIPVDQYRGSALHVFTTYRLLVLNRLPFNKVFDLFQTIMRHPQSPPGFSLDIAKTFERCHLAYIVDTAEPPTILPAATEQEGEAITRALHDLQEAGLQGAATHLRNAGGLINQGDWPGAVRESIHAVESVARMLAPASKTLDPALKSLEKNGRLHPALKEAFSRLYGYTSDEQGVRHALVDYPESPAGRDEALFMLGACASFASYLWRRRQSLEPPPAT